MRFSLMNIFTHLGRLGRGLKRCFTLSEILIVLAVLAVLIVLVIPVVTTRAQNRTLALSYESEVKQMVGSLDGLPINEGKGNIDQTMMFVKGKDEGKYENSSGAYINKYMKVAKYCGDLPGDCFASEYYQYKNNDRVSFDMSVIKGACALLKNGVSICLKPQVERADGNVDEISGWIDLTGPKGPNVYGRDLRTFFINLKNHSVYNDETGDVLLAEPPKVCPPGDPDCGKPECDPSKDVVCDPCKLDPYGKECCTKDDFVAKGSQDGCCLWYADSPSNPNYEICFPVKPSECSPSDNSLTCCAQRTIMGPSDPCCDTFKSQTPPVGLPECCTMEATDDYCCTVHPLTEGCCRYNIQHGRIKAEPNNYCCKTYQSIYNEFAGCRTVCEQNNCSNECCNTLERRKEINNPDDCCCEFSGVNGVNDSVAADNQFNQYCCRLPKNDSIQCCQWKVNHVEHYANGNTNGGTYDGCCHSNAYGIKGGNDNVLERCCPLLNVNQSVAGRAIDSDEKKECCRWKVAHIEKYANPDTNGGIFDYCCHDNLYGIKGRNANVLERCCKIDKINDLTDSLEKQYCCEYFASKNSNEFRTGGMLRTCCQFNSLKNNQLCCSSVNDGIIGDDSNGEFSGQCCMPNSAYNGQGSNAPSARCCFEASGVTGESGSEWSASRKDSCCNYGSQTYKPGHKANDQQKWQINCCHKGVDAYPSASKFNEKCCTKSSGNLTNWVGNECCESITDHNSSNWTSHCCYGYLGGANKTNSPYYGTEASCCNLDNNWSQGCCSVLGADNEKRRRNCCSQPSLYASLKEYRQYCCGADGIRQNTGVDDPIVGSTHLNDANLDLTSNKKYCCNPEPLDSVTKEIKPSEECCRAYSENGWQLFSLADASEDGGMSDPGNVSEDYKAACCKYYNICPSCAARAKTNDPNKYNLPACCNDSTMKKMHRLEGVWLVSCCAKASEKYGTAQSMIDDKEFRQYCCNPSKNSNSTGLVRGGGVNAAACCGSFVAGKPACCTSQGKQYNNADNTSCCFFEGDLATATENCCAEAERNNWQSSSSLSEDNSISDDSGDSNDGSPTYYGVFRKKCCALNDKYCSCSQLYDKIKTSGTGTLPVDCCGELKNAHKNDKGLWAKTCCKEYVNTPSFKDLKSYCCADGKGTMYNLPNNTQVKQCCNGSDVSSYCCGQGITAQCDCDDLLNQEKPFVGNCCENLATKYKNNNQLTTLLANSHYQNQCCSSINTGYPGEQRFGISEQDYNNYCCIKDTGDIKGGGENKSVCCTQYVAGKGCCSSTTNGHTWQDYSHPACCDYVDGAASQICCDSVQNPTDNFKAKCCEFDSERYSAFCGTGAKTCAQYASENVVGDGCCTDSTVLTEVFKQSSTLRNPWLNKGCCVNPSVLNYIANNSTYLDKWKQYCCDHSSVNGTPAYNKYCVTTPPPTSTCKSDNSGEKTDGTTDLAGCCKYTPTDIPTNVCCTYAVDNDNYDALNFGSTPENYVPGCCHTTDALDDNHWVKGCCSENNINSSPSNDARKNCCKKLYPIIDDKGVLFSPGSNCCELLKGIDGKSKIDGKEIPECGDPCDPKSSISPLKDDPNYYPETDEQAAIAKDCCQNHNSKITPPQDWPKYCCGLRNQKEDNSESTFFYNQSFDDVTACCDSRYIKSTKVYYYIPQYVTNSCDKKYGIDGKCSEFVDVSRGFYCSNKTQCELWLESGNDNYYAPGDNVGRCNCCAQMHSDGNYLKDEYKYNFNKFCCKDSVKGCKRNDSEYNYDYSSTSFLQKHNTDGVCGEPPEVCTLGTPELCDCDEYLRTGKRNASIAEAGDVDWCCNAMWDAFHDPDDPNGRQWKNDPTNGFTYLAFNNNYPKFAMRCCAKNLEFYAEHYNLDPASGEEDVCSEYTPDPNTNGGGGWAPSGGGGPFTCTSGDSDDEVIIEILNALVTHEPDWPVTTKCNGGAFNCCDEDRCKSEHGGSACYVPSGGACAKSCVYKWSVECCKEKYAMMKNYFGTLSDIESACFAEDSNRFLQASADAIQKKMNKDAKQLMSEIRIFDMGGLDDPYGCMSASCTDDECCAVVTGNSDAKFTPELVLYENIAYKGGQYSGGFGGQYSDLMAKNPTKPYCDHCIVPMGLAADYYAPDWIDSSLVCQSTDCCKFRYGCHSQYTSSPDQTIIAHGINDHCTPDKYQYYVTPKVNAFGNAVSACSDFK